MNYKEVLENARTCIGSYCKACNVCNGLACRNSIPGPGAKGVGDSAIRNYQKWQEIRVNMDTLCAGRPVDTTLHLFGQTFKYPFFAGPVGAVNMHYSDKFNDMTYNAILLSACRENGIAAFTGDGTDPKVMESATEAIAQVNGCGIPTVKPWNLATIKSKMELVHKAGAFAVAMDVDAAGLPFLKNMTPPAGGKSVDELRRISAMAGVPFIVKGIMNIKGALKAKEAGAKAIVVSNHGGRVLDQCPSTAEVLPEIAAAVSGGMKILVDGGIRSGTDIFKALALGADGVLICRPFVTAVYGGEKEGVKLYIEKLAGELKDTMAMCGAFSLSEITKDMVRGANLPQSSL
ncbi:MAG: alpha-hydroxy-acid oxidizing protein [Veillonellales bacterium]